MIKMLWQQLKVMFSRMGFWIGLTSMLVLCMANTAIQAFQNKDLDIMKQIAGEDVFILNWTSPMNEVLQLLYIFLLLLPFAFSYRKDVKLHIKPVLQTRMGVGRYYIINMMVCFIGTFLMFLLPLILEIQLDMILFPNELNLSFTYNELATISGDNVMVPTVQRGMPLKELYLFLPKRYNVVYAVFFSSFCGLLSVFVYTISYWIKNYNILLLLPLYVLTQLQGKVDALMDELSDVYLNVNMVDYFTIRGYFGLSSIYMLVLIGFFVGFIIVSTYIKCKKDQLE